MLDQEAQRDADTRHAMRVAERYAAIQARHIGEADSVAYLASRILDWHETQEALRLDLLADAKESDLAHDVSGILRADVFQSARYALAYHPREGFKGVMA